MDPNNKNDMDFSQESFDIFWAQDLYDQALHDIPNELHTGENLLQENMVEPCDSTSEFVNWNQNEELHLQQNNVSTSSLTLPVKQEAILANSLPANNNWPGEYGFDISFTDQQKTTKNAAWTYSNLKDKLYVTMNTPCPVRFHTTQTPPLGSVIRCMVIYATPEYAEETVKRCLHHSREEDPTNSGHPAPFHLVRCDSIGTNYLTDETTGRHVVVVPYEPPQEGMPHTTYLYKFMCLGSCVGGLNRRPIQIIFTLSHNNQQLGRRTLEVRICACPGRDRKNDEKHIAQPSNNEQGKKGKPVLQTSSEPPTKKRKRCQCEDKKYTLEVKNKKIYDMLKGIQKILEQQIPTECNCEGNHKSKSKK